MKFGVPSRLQGRKWILATIGVPILAASLVGFPSGKIMDQCKGQRAVALS